VPNPVALTRLPLASRDRLVGVGPVTNLHMFTRPLVSSGIHTNRPESGRQREPCSSANLRERFVAFASSRYKYLERVESRYPALPKLKLPKLREVVFHYLDASTVRTFSVELNGSLLALTGKHQQFVIELRADEKRFRDERVQEGPKCWESTRDASRRAGFRRFR
jgi:hypothetical protein